MVSWDLAIISNPLLLGGEHILPCLSWINVPGRKKDGAMRKRKDWVTTHIHLVFVFSA